MNRSTVINVLMALGLTLVGLSWSWASPTGSAADDSFHLSTIWCAWGDSETCQTKGDGAALTPQKIAEPACFKGNPDIPANCVRLQTTELTATAFINPIFGGYPPLFHSTMRVFVGTDIDRSVLVMRMFNAGLAGLMLLWALQTSTTTVRRALAVTWLVCLIPVGAFFIPSTNASSWAIIGVGTFWAFLLSWAQKGWGLSRQTLPTLAGAGAALVLALGARSDTGLPLVLTMLGVLTLTWSRRPTWKPIALVAGAVIALGTLASLFRIGRYFESSRLHWPRGNAEFDQPNPILKTLVELPSFISGLVGGQTPSWLQRESQVDLDLPGYSWHGFGWAMGWTDLELPSIVGALSGFGLAGVILIGLGFATRRKAIVQVLLLVVLIAQVLVMRSIVNYRYDWGLQTRWFLPLLLLFVGVTLLTSSVRLLTRTQAVVVGVFIAVSGTSALMGAISRYVNGKDHSWTTIDTSSGWWWPWAPSVAFLIVLTVIGLLLMAIAGVQIASSAKEDEDSLPESPALRATF